MRDDPEVLATATLDQLAKLITVLVRQERFAEVSLMGAFGGQDSQRRGFAHARVGWGLTL